MHTSIRSSSPHQNWEKRFAEGHADCLAWCLRCVYTPDKHMFTHEEGSTLWCSIWKQTSCLLEFCSQRTTCYYIHSEMEAEDQEEEVEEGDERPHDWEMTTTAAPTHSHTVFDLYCYTETELLAFLLTWHIGLEMSDGPHVLPHHPLLRVFHWLPVAAHTRFKALTLAYEAKNGPCIPEGIHQTLICATFQSNLEHNLSHDPWG